MLLIAVPACNSNQWIAFDGIKEYEYYYTEGRERLWEEDIIELAQNFLEIHPYLLNEEILCYNYYFNMGWKNTYDETKKQAFLKEVNQLIPRLSELTDMEVIYNVEKVIATLQDGHSTITNIQSSHGFPISVQPFYEEDTIKYYVTLISEEYNELMFAELISINNITIEEIVERLIPYVPADNEGQAINKITYWLSYLGVWNAFALRSIGVISKEDTSASFTLKTENEEKTIELPILDYNEICSLKKIDNTPSNVLDYLNTEKHSETFWYEVLGENMIYTRLSAFIEDSKKSLIQFVSELNNEIKEMEMADIIVDLRNNSGGRDLDGEDAFFKLLNEENVNKVYVLINSGTYSYAVAFATRLNYEMDNAVLVGMPAASGSEQLGYRYLSPFTMANTGFTYQVANTWYEVMPNENYNALQPELEIHQSLEDYKDGIDTVLSTIINMR